MNNEFIFKSLPKDIINYILSFTGKLSYINGRYIGKLDKNDEMYIKLISIPKPERILSNKYILYLINKNNNIGYILHYSINTNKNQISLHLISCKGLNDTKTIDYYVMPNLYSKWRRVLSLQNLS